MVSVSHAASTAWASRSTPSFFRIARKMSARLSMLGFPFAESMRCKLLAGFAVSAAKTPWSPLETVSRMGSGETDPGSGWAVSCCHRRLEENRRLQREGGGRRVGGLLARVGRQCQRGLQIDAAEDLDLVVEL